MVYNDGSIQGIFNGTPSPYLPRFQYGHLSQRPDKTRRLRVVFYPMKLVLVAVLLAGYIFLILKTFDNFRPHRIFPYAVALVSTVFGIFCSFYKLMCIHTNPSDELRRQNRDLITAFVTFIFYVFQNFMFLPLLFFEYVGHVCCTVLFLFTFQLAAFLINAPLAIYHLVGTPPNPRKMRELRAVEPVVKFKLGFYFFSLAYYSYVIWFRPSPSMASREGE